MISTPGSTEFTRGRRVSDATFIDGSGSDASESEEDADTTGLDDSGFTTNDSLVASAVKRKQAKGKYAEDSSDSENENEDNARRSSRRTKGVKHAWWKNERAVYDRVRLHFYMCVSTYIYICVSIYLFVYLYIYSILFCTILLISILVLIVGGYDRIPRS